MFFDGATFEYMSNETSKKPFILSSQVIFNKEHEITTIMFEHALKAGNGKLYILYTGILNEELIKFFQAKCHHSNKDTRCMTTNVPCWNNSQLKIPCNTNNRPLEENCNQIYRNFERCKPCLTKTELINRILHLIVEAIIIILLFIIFALVNNLQEPNIAYLTCDMSDISFPYVSSPSIPEWAVGI